MSYSILQILFFILLELLVGILTNDLICLHVNISTVFVLTCVFLQANPSRDGADMGL